MPDQLGQECDNVRCNDDLVMAAIETFRHQSRVPAVFTDSFERSVLRTKSDAESMKGIHVPTAHQCDDGRRIKAPREQDSDGHVTLAL